MKSGASHLPLGQIKLKGKLVGPAWSCGCCGNAFNSKKFFEQQRISNPELLHNLREAGELEVVGNESPQL